MEVPGRTCLLTESSKHFNDLRGHENTSDYILDLLDYIQDKMLRMAPEKRETMESIAPKLSELNDKCRVESYCTKRQNEPVIRRPTNLSEIEGVIFRSAGRDIRSASTP